MKTCISKKTFAYLFAVAFLGFAYEICKWNLGREISVVLVVVGLLLMRYVIERKL